MSIDEKISKTKKWTDCVFDLHGSMFEAWSRCLHVNKAVEILKQQDGGASFSNYRISQIFGS